MIDSPTPWTIREEAGKESYSYGGIQDLPRTIAHSSRRPALKPIMRVNQWYEGDKFFCLPGHVSSNPFELLLDLVVVGMVHLTAEAAAIATEFFHLATRQGKWRLGVALIHSPLSGQVGGPDGNSTVTAPLLTTKEVVTKRGQYSIRGTKEEVVYTRLERWPPSLKNLIDLSSRRYFLVLAI